LGFGWEWEYDKIKFERKRSYYHFFKNMDNQKIKFPWLKMIIVLVVLLVLGIMVSVVRGEYMLIEFGGQVFYVGTFITILTFLFSYARKTKSKTTYAFIVLIGITFILYVGNYIYNFSRALNPSDNVPSIPFVAQ